MSTENPDWGYFSHLPMLAAALVRTSLVCPGYDILECGCGFGSTPAIHYAAGSRKVVTVDTDDRWLSQFEAYKGKRHRFERVVMKATGATGITDWLTAWNECGVITETDQWGLAFVDCWPGEARVPIIKRLKRRAKLIIAHDAEADEPGAGGNYGWRQLDGLFAHVRTFKRIRPWTRLYTDDATCIVHIEDCDQ